MSFDRASESREPSIDEYDSHRLLMAYFDAVPDTYSDDSRLLTPSKKNYLLSLVGDVNEMSAAAILAHFLEIKNPRGEYGFLHKQKNPKGDKITFFFKQKKNEGEFLFHTKSFQKAVKILKDAYIEKAAGDTATLQAGSELIDYYRGNDMILPAKTKSRSKSRTQGKE